MKYFPSIILLFFSFFTSVSCSTNNDTTKIDQPSYFDLASYFRQQAILLQRKNPMILKTVGKNMETEQKKLKLDNWQKEFELFSSSDINKSDWRQSYRIDSTDEKLNYRAKSSRLRTKEITIYKNRNGIIKHIHILNGEKNWLYESIEQLDYYPDSLYQIAKEQSIRIIGQNQYTIIGKIL
ncbi:hypothetical protein RYH73_12865 [Olivibacter sp. CPCC 100613]|uniref:hypothetical protein n=1 Tax=Olivibacter sp. CPCC 100613 TaxID=3079931 RepID=UPI002FF44B45